MKALTNIGPTRVRRTLRRWRRLAEPRIVVLMYHRVSDLICDPWDQCVSPRHFDEQLYALADHMDVLPIGSVEDALKHGGPGYRAAVLTFDDGYADNLHAAKPILSHHGLPASFFLSTDALRRNVEFWWDELERIFLYPGRLPQELELHVNGRWYSWSLEGQADYSRSDWDRHCRWRAWTPPVTPRQRVYYGVWNLMRTLPHQQRETLLLSLSEWSNMLRTPRATHRVMSQDEAGDLARDSLFELGAHGARHVALPYQPVDEQIADIRASKSNIESLVNKPVRYFAYPFGDSSAETAAAVRDAGFSGALTTREAAVGRRANPWQWPRCKVYDWSGEQLARRVTSMLQHP